MRNFTRMQIAMALAAFALTGCCEKVKIQEGVKSFPAPAVPLGTNKDNTLKTVPTNPPK